MGRPAPCSSVQARRLRIRELLLGPFVEHRAPVARENNESGGFGRLSAAALDCATSKRMLRKEGNRIPKRSGPSGGMGCALRCAKVVRAQVPRTDCRGRNHC